MATENAAIATVFDSTHVLFLLFLTTLSSPPEKEINLLDEKYSIAKEK